MDHHKCHTAWSRAKNNLQDQSVIYKWAPVSSEAGERNVASMESGELSVECENCNPYLL